MSAREILMQEIVQSPDFMIEELLDFLLFAKARRNQQALSQKQKEIRPFGLCAGEFTVPPDFNEPYLKRFCATLRGIDNPMKLLLDTHIFLWFISGSTQLSTTFRDNIQDSDNDVYLSVVSLWECIIKYQLGKLPLPESPEVYLPGGNANYTELKVSLLTK